MIASATKFEIKGIIEHLIFLRMSLGIIVQAKKSSGLVSMRINPFSLRTLTVWQDEDSMKEFRNSGAHLAAMRASSKLGTPWSISWATNQPPTWRESVAKIDAKIKARKSA